MLKTSKEKELQRLIDRFYEVCKDLKQTRERYYEITDEIDYSEMSFEEEVEKEEDLQQMIGLYELENRHHEIKNKLVNTYLDIFSEHTKAAKEIKDNIMLVRHYKKVLSLALDWAGVTEESKTIMMEV